MRLKLNFLLLAICFHSINVFAQNDDPVFFQEAGLWGLKNSNGEVILKPKYTNNYEPYFYFNMANYAQIELNGKHGFIDKQGKEVLSPQFDNVSGIHVGRLVFVKKNNKTGLLDMKSLKVLTNFVYDHIIYQTSKIDYNPEIPDEIVETYFFKLNNGKIDPDKDPYGGKWGVYMVSDDNVSREVLPVEYDEVEIGDVLLVRKNDLWGSFTLEGFPVIPLKYSYIEYLSLTDDYLVSIDGGKKVQNTGWNDDRHYAGGKWGIVNRLDQPIIPFQYDYIRTKPGRKEIKDLEGDFIKVGIKNKYGMIDRYGKIILPLKYDDIDDNIYSFNDFMDINPYYDPNGLFRVKLNGKWGLVDKNDKQILPCSFDRIYYRSGIYEVVKGKSKTYCDKNGKKLTIKEAQEIMSMSVEEIDAEMVDF